jgi:hypothetical protein
MATKATTNALKEVAIKKKARSESMRSHEGIGDAARSKAKAISKRGSGRVKWAKGKTMAKAKLRRKV